MSEKFCLSLTDQEKAYLKGLVTWSISLQFNSKPAVNHPEPPTDKMNLSMGVFVTLTVDNRLRGCIGSLTGRGPLYLTVIAMARAAAFEDTRFPPLNLAEFERIKVELSILGPIERCLNPNDIEIGRHGLMIRQGRHSGLLLPQVAMDRQWDQVTFLNQTCRKAGLADQAWNDPKSELYWFEAEVF